MLNTLMNYKSIVYPQVDKRVSHSLLPLYIKKYQRGERVTDEYMALLFNWHHKLLKKYFKAEQHTRHLPRTLDVILLFLQFSREYGDKDAPWLITKWRFCLPDILYYLKLKERGIAVDEKTVKEIVSTKSSVAKLRELEVLSIKLRALNLQETPHNMEMLWRQVRKAVPLPKTLAVFRHNLNTRGLINECKRDYEHAHRSKHPLLSGVSH